MTDERLAALYRLAMEGRSAEASGCGVPLEVLVDVVEGRLPDAEHRSSLARIMADPRCRREFELLRAAAGRGAPPRAGRARTAWPLRIAASIVIALGAGSLWYAQLGPGDDPTRDQGVPPVELVAPSEGDHPRASLQFVWRPVPDALRYELSLVTAGGRAVYSATLTDTSLVLPDSVPADVDEDLRWWVEATTQDGVQVRAPLRRLRVISP